MDPKRRLQWQHETLEKVCGQMPKSMRDDTFKDRKNLRDEIETVRANQQLDALSLDV